MQSKEVIAKARGEFVEANRVAAGYAGAACRKDPANESARRELHHQIKVADALRGMPYSCP